MKKRVLLVSIVALAGIVLSGPPNAVANAQAVVHNEQAQSLPYNPVVEIQVTLPDGQTKSLSIPESGLATVTVGDAGYGFRPTIVDSRPWTHVIVTIFKMGTSTEGTREASEVDLKTGGPAVSSKGIPSFKVAVVKVSPAPGMSASERRKTE